MKAPRHGVRSFTTFLSLFVLAFTLTACEGDDGEDGAAGVPGAPGDPGADGAPGADGDDGISCWDLNENLVADAAEDINGDGNVDVFDCNAIAGGASPAAKLHITYFTDNAYTGTGSCLNCHGPIGDAMLETGHFKWEGLASNVTGYENETHGKKDFLNNFCVAVPSNEGRCTQCHTGYGWDDNTYAFNDPETIDCLVCHDQTGDYFKPPPTAGLPDPNLDLTAIARSVANRDGVPTIDNCIYCHARAGGEDNVKHGDLAMSLEDTTREYDVHMGTDGADFECTACHNIKRDNITKEPLDHGMGGMPYHSVDEGKLKTCTDCHGDVANIHVNTTVENILTAGGDGNLWHDKLACQVCHVPAIARDTSTKTEWYWNTATEIRDPATIPQQGTPPRNTFDRKKGDFVWENNVRPTLLYTDGMWFKRMINVNDTFTETPVIMAEPSADWTTPGAMIYPFKKMIGKQPADTGPEGFERRILVPHLFGDKGGPNKLWGTWDWGLALQDGTTYANQPYSGNFEFVDTIMYLSVNHEIAPKEEAFGYDNLCSDCHGGPQIDWPALGWTADPLSGGGERPGPE